MGLLNTNGTDGPKLIKKFSCENCNFLGDAAYHVRKPYKCFHPNVIKKDNTQFKIINGNITSDKITPSFCPFIMKKYRCEKIKEIEKHTKIITKNANM